MSTVCGPPATPGPRRRRTRRQAPPTGCLALLGLALLVGCGNGGASAPDTRELTRAELGPVSLSVIQTPASPTLVDLVTLTLLVQYDEGVQVRPPPFGEAFDERFLVRDYRVGDPELVEEGRWRRSYSYVLEPVWSGENQVPPVELTFDDQRPAATGSETGEHTLATDPFVVEVTPVAVGEAPSPEDLRPPAPPAALPPAPWPWWVVGLVILGALLLVVLGVRLWRRSQVPPPPPPPIPPRELARAALDRLRQAGYLELGRVRDFYYALTDIVRRFMEGEYHLHAPEQTTEEFLRELAITGRLSAPLEERLARFLEAADQVKYAARNPGPDGAQESLQAARAIIDHEERPRVSVGEAGGGAS
jgi:hypothetical protein